MASSAHNNVLGPMPRIQQQLRESPHMSRAPSQMDEGYSEGTLSQTDVTQDEDEDMSLTPDAEALVGEFLSGKYSSRQRLLMLRELVGALSHKDKIAHTKVIHTLLPNWARQVVGEDLDSLMFFDPAQYLSTEVFDMALGYLSPKDLLSASEVNREWRHRALEDRLWRSCFQREGWKVDKSKIREVERVGLETKLEGKALERRDSRKRRREEAFSEGEASMLRSTTAIAGSVEGESSSDNIGDGMEDLDYTGSVEDAENNHIAASGSAFFANTAAQPLGFQVEPPQWVGEPGRQRIGWAYLYKHRRRLERNWEGGYYQMASLPHKDYPNEGHQECVYTIQHTDTELVSGSRDKTIRIWDLKTCRLKNTLLGHRASVLCLQADPTPENDIIVSGGSDSLLIIWKYSTGKPIKVISTAHNESILNLRFDHRYIVTCSKDKSIKIWNRHAIKPDDPIVPSHVFSRFQSSPAPLLEEHTLLTTLVGHQAAVNAVVIHDDTIVSASGDRTVKAWNIQSGKCAKSYVGHTKGIACVQYDGRRIISGSSDNTVRIFDGQTRAEVACLSGHDNLVRTVQARFGDLETRDADELQVEARRADENYHYARDNGMVAAPQALRRAPRNAGSNRPEEMMALGAKVPPSGGGSKWAKIVSGSYDETVIIWRKEKNTGQWKQNLRLHQDFLLQRPGRRRVPHTALALPANLNDVDAQGGRRPPQGNSAVAQQLAQQAHGHLQTVSSLLSQPPSNSNLSNHQLAQLHQTTNALTAQHQQLVANIASAANQNQAPPQQQQQQQAPPQQPQALQQQAGHPPTAPAQQQQQHGYGHGHHAHAPAAGGAQPQQHGNAHARDSNSNRIFKLQFDVRRIISCSQNKTIVCWDFANGDEDLAKVGDWSEETC